MDEIKKKMEEMNQVAQKIGAAMYQQQSAPGGQGAQTGTSASADTSADKQPGAEKKDDKKNDDPVEGEFEEKK